MLSPLNPYKLGQNTIRPKSTAVQARPPFNPGASAAPPDPQARVAEAAITVFKAYQHYLLQYLPRLQAENLEHNKKLFERVNDMAAKKGCTPSQLALAWVHHQGNDVCPIPGTTKLENFKQNIAALSVKLSAEDMAELESIASADAVKGDRYWSGVSTWESSDTPPLATWKST